MSEVTVSVAAKLTGKSRETINAACNDGTLSSSKNAQGVKVIQVAELARVYPLIKTMDEVSKSEPVRDSQGLTTEPSDLREQVAVLKAQLQGAITERDLMKSERERERHQLERQIETLETSLERAQEHGSKAMMLITDQSNGKAERELEQERAVRELAATVAKLQGHNKRLHREVLEMKKRGGFWKWLMGRGGSPSEKRTTPEPSAQRLA